MSSLFQAVAPTAKITYEKGIMIVTKPANGETHFPEYEHGFTQIGKTVDKKVYVHKDYIDDSVMSNEQKQLAHKIYANLTTEEQNTYRLLSVNDDLKKAAIMESIDFDTADEPQVNRTMYFDGQGERMKGGTQKQISENPKILHGKHLWVGEGYKGFDRIEAEKRFFCMA